MTDTKISSYCTTPRSSSKRPSPEAADEVDHVENQQQTQNGKPKNLTTDAVGYLDCQSLQRSLKRVRLSSSPGELCLQRDLRHLVCSEGWIPLQSSNNHYHDSASTSSSSTSTSRRLTMDYDDVYCHVWQNPLTGYTLERPVPSDPLRLYLNLTPSGRHQASVWMQIPRLYPHRPPVFGRLVSAHSRIQHVVLGAGPDETTASLAAAATASSSATASASAGLAHPITTTSATTAVYAEWSPVKRLTHVIDFMVQILTGQHDQHNDHNNNNNNHDHLVNQQQDIDDLPFENGDADMDGGGSSNGRQEGDISSRILSDRATTTTGTCAGISTQEADKATEKPSSINSNALRMSTGSSPFTNGLFWLVEEHKMDDSDSRTASSSSNGGAAAAAAGERVGSRNISEVSTTILLPPNRFDLGYERVTAVDRSEMDLSK
jgi:hypothetical protein